MSEDIVINSHSRRAIEILTRQNQEKWFKMMKQWFKNEKFWKIINFDNETTFISTFIETFERSISSDKSLFDKNVNFEEEKLNARIQYHLLNCINDDDQELVSKQTTTRKI